MKHNGTVYLAGPITGMKFNETVHWRDYVGAALQKHGIRSRSPMRHVEHLAVGNQVMPARPEDEPMPHPLRTSKAITARDRFDLMNSDVVFMNLIGATRISIGTMIEVGWADAFRKPIVLAMEPGNMHDHGMVREITAFIGATLDDAIELAKSILMTGVLTETC